MGFDELARKLGLAEGTRIEWYDDLRDLAEDAGTDLGKTSQSEVKGIIRFLRSRGIEVDAHTERDLNWLASDRFDSYDELFFILGIKEHSHFECNTELIQRAEGFWERPVRFVDVLAYIWIETDKRMGASFRTKFTQEFSRTARPDRMRGPSTCKVMFASVLRDRVEGALLEHDMGIIRRRSPTPDEDLPMYREITVGSQACTFYSPKKGAERPMKRLQKILGRELSGTAKWPV